METLNFKRIMFIVGGILALILLMFFQPFGINDSGYRTHVQQVDGHEFIRFEPGMYYAGFFAKTTSYPDVITVQFEQDKDRKEEISYFNQLITCQFNDGTYAQVGFTVKWKLPIEEKYMLMIHKDYRSTTRLAASLADYSKECMNYSMPLMTSEHHYSGGKSELRDHFQYQLRNGQYILVQGDHVERDTMGVEKHYYTSIPRVDSTGAFVLSKSDVQTYHITPTFVAITHVDYEDAVDQKLKAKVDQSTAESVSKQQLMTAQQKALTAKAEGERMVAEAKAQADAEKETEVIKKQKEVELARLAAQQAKFEAERVRAEGDALAAKNQALVRAGLTPLERATIEKETRIGVAAELAKVQFPQMMILGGDNKGPLDPFSAIGLKSFMDIQERMMTSKQ